MQVFLFHKQGFKHRQSQKLKDPGKRYGIMLDCGLNTDPKILMLHRQGDHTLLGIYLEILFNLDIETETWEIREDHLFQWVKTTFDTGNRFDLKKRLRWLSENGLIELQQVPMGLPLPSHNPAMGQSSPSHAPTETPFGRSLDRPQTQAHSDKNLHKQPTKQPNNISRSEFHSDGVNPSQEICDPVPAQKPSDPVWDDGLLLLTGKSTPEPQARSFLGALVKTHGKDAVTDAIAKAIIEDPAEPKAYLKGILQRVGNRPTTPTKPLTRETLEVQAACERRAKRMEAMAQDGR